MMMRQFSFLAIALCVLSLSSCYYYYPAEPAPAPVSANTTTFQARSANASSGQLYVVQRGDTLYRIARRYGRTVNQLMAWNSLASARNLQVGQRLWVTPPSNRTFIQ